LEKLKRQGKMSVQRVLIQPDKASKIHNQQLHPRTPGACLGAIARELIDALIRELGGRVCAMPRATVPMQKEALR